MGLIEVQHSASDGGRFRSGGASLHNQMIGHGPDKGSSEKAALVEAVLEKIQCALACMFDMRHVILTYEWVSSARTIQLDIGDCWRGLATAEVAQ